MGILSWTGEVKAWGLFMSRRDTEASSVAGSLARWYRWPNFRAKLTAMICLEVISGRVLMIIVVFSYVIFAMHDRGCFYDEKVWLQCLRNGSSFVHDNFSLHLTWLAMARPMGAPLSNSSTNPLLAGCGTCLKNVISVELSMIYTNHSLGTKRKTHMCRHICSSINSLGVLSRSGCANNFVDDTVVEEGTKTRGIRCWFGHFEEFWGADGGSIVLLGPTSIPKSGIDTANGIVKSYFIDVDYLTRFLKHVPLEFQIPYNFDVISRPIIGTNNLKHQSRCSR